MQINVDTLLNTLELSGSYLCVVNIEGVFQEVSPQFEKKLGYEPQFLVNRLFTDFLHPNDMKSSKEEVNSLFNLKEPTINYENRYRCLDGSYITFSWTAVLNPNKETLYCIAKDVSQERRTQNELEHIYNALNTKTIVAITDDKGIITQANDIFCEISGYSRAELLGKNHRILNSGKHPADFFKNMWETISSGRVWAGLITNLNKNGEEYHVHTIISPSFDTLGEIKNYISIRFDVTDYIKLQRHLDKTLKILNETSSIAKIGGWELDIATNDLTWTEETFKILEYKKQPDLKLRLDQGVNTFTEEYQPIIDKAVKKAIEFGESYSLEAQVKTLSGEKKWIHTNGHANYRDGKIVTLSGTIRDIDRRKKIEEKYQIEQMISIQKSKLASLGEMSAGIAHEINNPLAIILGSASLLNKFKNNDEKFDQKVNHILKSCERISRIVNSLKKFSRSHEKRLFQNKALAEILEESMILVDSKKRKFDVKITFSCPKDVIIYCDDIEIEQVLVNLINNSLDAIQNLEEKWIRIVVEEDMDSVYLKITDSGFGIPDGLKDKLFEPFFTTKIVGEGTGLGLSISKGILEEHGASINLAPNSNKTCFIITFPKNYEKKNEDDNLLS